MCKHAYKWESFYVCVCVCGAPLSRHICLALISFGWQKNTPVSPVFNNSQDSGHLSRSEYSWGIVCSFGKIPLKWMCSFYFLRMTANKFRSPLHWEASWNMVHLCCAYLAPFQSIFFFIFPPSLIPISQMIYKCLTHIFWLLSFLVFFCFTPACSLLDACWPIQRWKDNTFVCVHVWYACFSVVFAKCLINLQKEGFERNPQKWITGWTFTTDFGVHPIQRTLTVGRSY